MAGLLANFRNTMIVSTILAIIMIAGYFNQTHGDARMFAEAVLRWGHVVAGILWIGLLYYFNFVQIRVMPNIPAELKPAVSKHIAPEALFWFRWAALVTWVLGVVLALHRGYFVDALTIGFAEGFGAAPSHTFIGVGMWLERYLIVVPTLVTPRLASATSVYSPSWVELMITVATFAAMILLYLLFARLFPIIAVWEYKPHSPEEED